MIKKPIKIHTSVRLSNETILLAKTLQLRELEQGKKKSLDEIISEKLRC